MKKINVFLFTIISFFLTACDSLWLINDEITDIAIEINIPTLVGQTERPLIGKASTIDDNALDQNFSATVSLINEDGTTFRHQTVLIKNFSKINVAFRKVPTGKKLAAKIEILNTEPKASPLVFRARSHSKVIRKTENILHTKPNAMFLSPAGGSYIWGDFSIIHAEEELSSAIDQAVKIMSDEGKLISGATVYLHGYEAASLVDLDALKSEYPTLIIINLDSTEDDDVGDDGNDGNDGGDTPETYTLYFDANGGSNLSKNSISVTESQAIAELPTVLFGENTFEYWTIDGEIITSDTVWNYTEDKTAFAVWTSADAPTTVYLNGTATDDGTGTSSSPFNSFESARKALINGGTIWVMGPVSITTDVGTWLSVDNVNKPIVLKRYSGLKNNPMIMLSGSNAKLKLQNITVDGQGGINSLEGSTETTSPLIAVNTGGTLTIANGALIQNNKRVHPDAANIYSNITGSGIYVSGSNLIMTGGQVSSNQIDGGYTSSGGGIYLSNANFTMSDGKISGNAVLDYRPSGGGIYASSSTIEMTGGEISANRAESGDSNSSERHSRGGGVYAASSTFTMSSTASIKNNRASTRNYYSDPYGGGVYASSSFFNMNGGEISGNSVYASQSDYELGDGLYVTGGRFTMTHGVVQSNDIYLGSGNVFLSNYPRITSYITYTNTTSSPIYVESKLNENALVYLNPSKKTSGTELVRGFSSNLFITDNFYISQFFLTKIDGDNLIVF